MGITEYSRYRGCELNAVQEAVAAGRIQRNADGQIDAEQADRDWELNSIQRTEEPKAARGPRRGGKGRGSRAAAVDDDERVTVAVPGIPYAPARALSQVYEAQRRELVVERMRGSMVLRSEVEAEAHRLYRQMRDACLQLPARLSAQLAAEKDPHRVHALLAEEIRQLFLDFSDGKFEER